MGPILFTIYINDLDDEIKSKILKFTDHIKLTGRMSNDKQIQIIKEDLTVLSNWVSVWEIPLHILTVVIWKPNTRCFERS